MSFFEKWTNGVDKKMKKIGLPIFLDLKLHDIPNTVKQSFKNVLDLKPNYLTVHLSGGYKMIEELQGVKKETKIIGVSMLTSLDNEDLKKWVITLGKKILYIILLKSVLKLEQITLYPHQKKLKS